MTFEANPLSLSVPEPAFETWLRDSGYLPLLDHRTSLLHSLHSSPSTTVPTAPTTTPTTATSSRATTTITTIAYTFTMSLISSLTTLFSLLTLNPFAKLTSSDFSTNKMNGFVNNWAHKAGFFGSFETYSFPSSPTQARMRVHENVKRFAPNYAVLSLVVFACSLYQMPLALFGLLSCLAIWELCIYCNKKWTLDRYPAMQQVLIRLAQFAVAVILFWTNVQTAVFCTLGISYAVLILHASFRKLTPAMQPSKGRGR